MKSNYIVIQGWMVSDLNLSGNDLLVFGLIYGFCQDGESEFKGSIKYVCDWLNCTRPTAMKALNNLVEKSLITKRIVNYNNVIFNRYKVNLDVVKNLAGGSKETLRGGSKETLHNNTILDNNKEYIHDKELDTFQVDISFDDFWNNYSSKLTDGNIARKKQAITAWNKLNPEEKQKAIDYACLVKKMDTPKDFVTSPDKLLNLKRFNERPHEHVTSVKPKEDLELFKYQSKAEVISLIIQSQVNLIKSYRAYLACCNELGNNPITEKEFFDLK